MDASCHRAHTADSSIRFVEKSDPMDCSEPIAIRFSSRGQPPSSLKQWLEIDDFGIKDRYMKFKKLVHDWRRDGACHPELSDYYSRIVTFADWPKLCPARPDDLCAAGFYYAGFAEGILDCVKCWYCDHGFCFFAYNDNPLDEHRKSNPDCPVVLSIK